MRHLTICLIAYCAASFFHHLHNAEFLDQYPHLPAWLSRAWIYLAWLAATAVGIAGYVLLRQGRRLAGLLLLALYGAWGFDGLAHYALAPLSAHTPMMNASIWLEAATAALLLTALISAD
jgi:hypothetical protein